LKSWQTIRVFISSTFRDMHAERDHLVKVVFPKLRERLERFRVELIDIDLRWGITEAQANDGRVLELCLQQIDECRPYFIGLLGQRYGWVPTELPESALRAYGWIRNQEQKSITELEIEYGILNNPRMSSRAFFFFRDEEALRDVPVERCDSVFRETDTVYSQKLSSLKEKILESGCTVTVYSARWNPMLYDPNSQSKGRFGALEGFGEAVEEQLFSAICKEHGFDEVPSDTDAEDDLGRELDYHERFIHSRLKTYVGRDSIHDGLLRYMHGANPKPLLLAGPSGAGKSATLAHLIRSLAGREKQTVVISHFVGASPHSTNLRFTLQRLCRLLKEQSELEDEIPDTTDELVGLFRSLIEGTRKTEKLVLIVDGLDQFEEMDQPQELYWLPETLAANVRIIISCNESSDRANRAIQRAKEIRFEQLFLTGLDDDERTEIIRQVPSISAKTLDESQVDLLMRNPATRNPLFLSIALEELKGFGSFEHLNQRIDQFPNPANSAMADEDAVEGIFQQVIGRLENDFNAELVMTALCLLACARRGLSEGELGALTRGQKRADYLFPLLRQLRSYLVRKGNILSFYHRSLWRAVQQRYLTGDTAKKAWHRKLADFFGATVSPGENDPGSTGLRVLEEFAWQLWKAESWAELYELLSDLDFIGGLSFGDRNEVYHYWSEIEKKSGFRLVNAYGSVIENPVEFGNRKRYCRYWRTIWRPYRFITELLIHFCYYAEAKALLDRMMGECDSEDPEYHYCAMQLRSIYSQTGEIEAALVPDSVENADPEIRAYNLLSRAVALASSGEPQKSLDLLNRSEQIGRQQGLKRITGQALANKAHIYIEKGMYAEANVILGEAEAVAREIGDMNLLGHCLGNQGVVLRIQGDLDEALRLHEEQRELCETLSDRHGLSIAICQQALVLEESGRTDDALAVYREAENICRETSNLYWLDFSLARQGDLLHEAGDELTALACYEECERLREKLGAKDELRRVLECQIDILAARDPERMVQKVEKLKGLNS
jgi:tetratricopeptide (TPR) repeat protein